MSAGRGHIAFSSFFVALLKNFPTSSNSLKNAMGIGKFLRNLRSLSFDDVGNLRICFSELGLLIIIIVMKGVFLIVKSPDVNCVNR